MAKRVYNPFVLVSLKKTNGKEYKSCPASISESATLLGTADVPNPHGNGICHYAYLLIRKLNEVGNHRSEFVTLCIDQSGTAAKDKNNNIKIKFPHENLTYVWVHPTEPRVLGVIVTFKEHESEKMMSKFTAFRMSSKAKKFAYRIQRIYCEYMDGLHAKLSTASVIIDEVPILETIDKSFRGDELIRKNADFARMEISNVLSQTHYRPVLSRRSNSSVEGLKSLERLHLHGMEFRRTSSSSPNDH
ncbi:expressed conserved protein [Echinococcus multilocularis]|uniref:Expressed conserved protein n=1 Tax=Echinococcus multilocularis TaxID=6211 RepID=A0A087VXF1_ECHMU|nr:expressed conserved protein [Echinococcus multilocularis]